MNKNYLESKMKLHGDTNASLAEAIGIAPQTLSNKKNGTNGSEFTTGEVMKIADRYSLTSEEICAIFFAKVSS